METVGMTRLQEREARKRRSRANSRGGVVMQPVVGMHGSSIDGLGSPIAGSATTRSSISSQHDITSAGSSYNSSGSPLIGQDGLQHSIASPLAGQLGGLGSPGFMPNSVGSPTYSSTNRRESENELASMLQDRRTSDPFHRPSTEDSRAPLTSPTAGQVGVVASERALATAGISGTYVPEEVQETSKISRRSIASHPLVFDRNDVRAFVSRPAPRDMVVQCRVVRDRSSFEKRTFPEYQMILEGKQISPGYKDRMLMGGRKRKKSRTSHYLISSDVSNLERQSVTYLGKVKSNFLGTQYVVYDKGENPLKAEPGTVDPDNPAGFRQELAVVMYESTAMKLRGAPRKITTLVPSLRQDGSRVQCVPLTEEQSMASRFREGVVDNMCVMQNKAPVWDEAEGTHVLDFGDRVTCASVKNFQLTYPNDPSTIFLQFGKVGENEFTLDFRYPISPLQAFGIALTSIDSKLACE